MTIIATILLVNHSEGELGHATCRWAASVPGQENLQARQGILDIWVNAYLPASQDPLSILMQIAASLQMETTPGHCYSSK